MKINVISGLPGSAPAWFRCFVESRDILLYFHSLYMAYYMKPTCPLKCYFFSYVAPDGTPLSFEATAITSSEFTLSWAAPLPAKTNGVLREYSLSIVEQKSGFYVLEDVEIEVGSNVTEFAVDYLLPYTVYNCSVSAITVAKGPEAVISVLTSEKGTV